MSDALLSPAVGLGFHAAAAGLLGVTARRAAREDGYERRLPLMGVLGAFVFAAQMVTFAIPGTGSSGHVAGGTLLAILLGPSASFLVMASVLTVQALFFADGGLLALGCNLFNLGFWPAFVGVALYRVVVRRWPGSGSPLGPLLAAVGASLLSTELGAAGVAVETALSHRSDIPLRELLVAMTAIHFPIGIVEGLVTAAVVRAIARWAPDRVDAEARPGAARIPVLAAITGVALFAATVLASFASERPDGLTWALERVAPAAPAEHVAGIGASLRALQERVALLPGYAWRGLERRPGLDPGTTTSGLLGSLVVVGFVLVAGGAVAVLRRARPDRARRPQR